MDDRCLKSSLSLSLMVLLTASAGTAAAQPTDSVLAIGDGTIVVDVGGPSLDLGAKVEITRRTPDGRFVAIGDWCVAGISIVYGEREITAWPVAALGPVAVGMDATVIKLVGEEKGAWLEQAAGRGCAGAQTRLGQRYLRGRDVAMDETKGLHWLREAAKQDEPHALMELADHVRRSLGEDRQEAFKLNLRAAEQGSWLAQKKVGHAYLLGNGVEQNVNEAELWYRRAADTAPSFDEPLYDLAHWLEMLDEAQSLGGRSARDMALEIYRESARKGGEKSQRELRKRGLQW